MSFEPVLFHTTPDYTAAGVAAGVRAVIVDWEHRGKERRQRGFDTQVSRHRQADLVAARACQPAQLLCRLNAHGPHTAEELAAALEIGVDEVLLPMVRTLSEVRTTLRLAKERCGVGILIETADAVKLAPVLATLPLTRIYVGLNDLAIDRRSRHIFMALADGTVERVSRAVGSIPFGFGGLTLPDRGAPLPCRYLVAELARLGSRFSFLRRSFFRDVPLPDLPRAIPALAAALRRAQDRPAAQVEAERDELVKRVRQLPPGAWRETEIAREHAAPRRGP